MQSVKSQFPIFTHHPDLVYLDNAATTQKPQRVIDAIVNYYSQHNANVHRGLYPLSEAATDMYEAVRTKVAEFIGAKPHEIIFTSGTTDSLNAAAGMFGKFITKPEIKVLLSEMEHHANILPWQQLPQAKLTYAKLNDNYELDLTNVNDIDHFDIIALTQVSNVTGTKVDIAQLRKLAPEAVIIIDAAQSVAHLPINVAELGVDALAFSGHKLYGPTGIGVLYLNEKWHDRLTPYRTGGGMITSVLADRATWAAAPQKFEAGTPNIAGVMGLAAAIDFITEIGFDTIISHEQDLRSYASQQLTQIPGLKLFHPQRGEHGAVLSFELDKIHSHDVSQILGEQGIAVRAGHHCTHILHRDFFDSAATTRASFAIYNDRGEVDKLVGGLQQVLEKLGGGRVG